MNKLYLSIALSLGLLTSVYCIMISQGTERFAWICSTIYAATSLIIYLVPLNKE